MVYSEIVKRVDPKSNHHQIKQNKTNKNPTKNPTFWGVIYMS